MALTLPAFRLKQQVIPGRSIAFFLTTHPGEGPLPDCGHSEYSGTWFRQPGDVVVQSENRLYQDWLAPGQPPALQRDSAMPPGKYALRQKAARGRRDTPLCSCAAADGERPRLQTPFPLLRLIAP